MGYVTPEQIAKAKEMDLLTYLQIFEPTELVKVSPNTYCTREHDSLKISNGKWCWHSRGIGGKNALKYLIEVKNIPFTEAVEIITGQTAVMPSVSRSTAVQPPKPKVLLLPKVNRSATVGFNYLRSRGIDAELINHCIRTGRFYESYPHHSAVFVGLDKENKPRYATIRGIGNDFIGEANGSDKRYSFSFPAEHSDTLKVLEENGLLKEQNDVKTLVSYIEDMETKLFDMSAELKEMHGEVGKIRDSTLRARCTQLITAASEKIQQASQMVVSCKDNLIKSAKNALQAFKEKGKDALITAVNAMKIPSALDMLKNGFHRAAESLGKSVSNLETVRNELHDVGTHLKNAGRALIGKPIKENEELKADTRC